MAEQKSNFFEGKIGNQTAVMRKNAQQYSAILNEQTSEYKEHLTERERAEQRLQNQIARYAGDRRSKEYKNLLKELDAATAARIKAEEEFQEAKLRVSQEAWNIANMYEENNYKKMSASERRAYAAKVAEEVAMEKSFLQTKLKLNESALAELNKIDEANRTDAQNKEIDRLASENKDLEKRLDQATSMQEKATEASRKFSKAELATSKGRQELRESRKDAAAEKTLSAADKLREKQAQAELKRANTKDGLTEQLEKAKKANNKAEIDRITKALQNTEALTQADAELANAESEANQAKEELIKASKEEIATAIKNKASQAADAFVNKTSEALSSNLDAIYGQQGRMMGRLQGSGERWSGVTGLVTEVMTNVGLSGFVSQKGVVAKMVSLVDSGVAYNLEMRAFLAEVSENIASTFDATNGTLLRLIRIQQSDSTAARLGMEASLTKLFNEYFQDNSYLKEVSDSVTSAILEASSMLNTGESVEFEYTLQKWLGSLYSIGMSSGAVSKIAEGINYLGTGNVSALNSDNALQTLLAMSAARAGGKSYAEMLLTGIDSDDTNKLLKAMVEYLAEIAESQTNYVTKAAYADLFGMSVTDFNTFKNLTTSEVNSLYANNRSYDSFIQETQSQLLQIMTRMNISQIVDTAIDNAEVGAAVAIGSNAGTYGLWKTLTTIKDYVGEVKIPGITGMGTGISSDTDLLNLAMTSVAGLGLIGSLLGGVASMAQGGALNLGAWSSDAVTKRGSGLSALLGGSSLTTSESSMLSKLAVSASGSDVESVSMQSATDSATEAGGTTSEELEQQKELPQKIYEALYVGSEDQTVATLLQEINNRLDPQRVFYTAIAGVLTSDAVKQVTNLSSQLSSVSVTSSSGDTENNNITGVSESMKDPIKALTGDSSLTKEDAAMNFETVIANAVAMGLQQYGFSGSFAIPVTLTSMTPGGGA